MTPKTGVMTAKSSALPSQEYIYIYIYIFFFLSIQCIQFFLLLCDYFQNQ